MANTNLTPVVGGVTASGVAGLAARNAFRPFIGVASFGGAVTISLPDQPEVTFQASLRPLHAWLESLSGVVKSRLHGGSFQVHVTDTLGRIRTVRVKPSETL